MEQVMYPHLLAVAAAAETLGSVLLLLDATAGAVLLVRAEPPAEPPAEQPWGLGSHWCRMELAATKRGKQKEGGS